MLMPHDLTVSMTVKDSGARETATHDNGLQTPLMIEWERAKSLSNSIDDYRSVRSDFPRRRVCVAICFRDLSRCIGVTRTVLTVDLTATVLLIPASFEPAEPLHP